jgi:hypothetical protein
MKSASGTCMLLLTHTGYTITKTAPGQVSQALL